MNSRKSPEKAPKFWQNPAAFVLGGLGILGILGALTGGCGQSPDLTLGAGAVATPTPYPSYTPPPTVAGSPNYSFHIEEEAGGNAYPVSGGSNLQITTDTTLTITLMAGYGVPVNDGSGYTYGFNCEQFDIIVGNVSKTAFVKKQSYTDVPLEKGWMNYDPCEFAQTSWTGDFSAALGPGHQTVTIQVSNGMYDNCRLFDSGYFEGIYFGGCVLSQVFSSHLVDAFLYAFTN
jgi:hypothetical protein